MKHEELAAIKERCEKATAGPWKHLSLGVKAERAEAVGRTHVAATHNQERIVTRHDRGTSPSFDAEFIAHARTDIPALVAEVERLLYMVEAVKAYRNAHAASTAQLEVKPFSDLIGATIEARYTLFAALDAAEGGA